VAHSR